MIWFPDVKSFIIYVESSYMPICMFSKNAMPLINLFYEVNNYRLKENMLVNYMICFSRFGIYRVIYKLFGGLEIQATDKWTPIILYKI